MQAKNRLLSPILSRRKIQLTSCPQENEFSRSLPHFLVYAQLRPEEFAASCVPDFLRVVHAVRQGKFAVSLVIFEIKIILIRPKEIFINKTCNFYLIVP